MIYCFSKYFINLYLLFILISWFFIIIVHCENLIWGSIAILVTGAWTKLQRKKLRSTELKDESFCVVLFRSIPLTRSYATRSGFVILWRSSELQTRSTFNWKGECCVIIQWFNLYFGIILDLKIILSLILGDHPFSSLSWINFVAKFLPT